MILLLLLLLPQCLTLTASPSSSSSFNLSFQQFNVQQSLLHATTKPPAAAAINLNHSSPRKLTVLHRDAISGGKALSRGSRVRSLVRRDSVRVSSIVRRVSVAPSSFGSEGVVSGMESGSGEYFVSIGVGSPPKKQVVVMDSGSDIIWVQCQPCSHCYRQSDPLFNPADSSSFSRVPCSSSLCSRLDSSSSSCRRGPCPYQVSYGDGSFTKGTLALESLTIGNTLVRDVAIGCGHTNQGMFVGAAGLLGLGAGSMSFVAQLGGQTGGAFTYCLASPGSGSSGSLEFGRQAMPAGAAWVPLARNPQALSFYYVPLSGLGVGGQRLQIPEDVFRLTEFGDGGVVMDTGTAVTRLPTAAYAAFRDAFVSQTTNLPRSPAVSIFDACFDLNGFVTVRVPTVSFYFSGGPILTLPARNFLIPVDDQGTFCFAFAPSPSGLSIIGNIQQEGIQISVDGANGFVGFGPNIC